MVDVVGLSAVDDLPRPWDNRGGGCEMAYASARIYFLLADVELGQHQKES